MKTRYIVYKYLQFLGIWKYMGKFENKKHAELYKFDIEQAGFKSKIEEQ